MKKWKIVLLVIFLVVVLPIGIFVCNTVSWFAREAVETAKAEFSPQELLRKYEWFKDASATLDKKVADIAVFNAKIESYKMLIGTGEKLDRTDKEIFAQWMQEVAGIKAGYNTLSAEYNSQMAKFNWRFCNAGTLPEGATEVLPRDYKPYQYD